MTLLALCSMMQHECCPSAVTHISTADTGSLVSLHTVRPLAEGELLSARGAAYLLHFDAAWLLEEVAATGLAASVVAEETEVGERWCIVRVERPTPRAADG